jgi:hypothetical protein
VAVATEVADTDIVAPYDEDGGFLRGFHFFGHSDSSVQLIFG